MGSNRGKTRTIRKNPRRLRCKLYATDMKAEKIVKIKSRTSEKGYTAKERILRAGKCGGGRKRFSGAAPLPHGGVFLVKSCFVERLNR